MKSRSGIRRCLGPAALGMMIAPFLPLRAVDDAQLQATARPAADLSLNPSGEKLAGAHAHFLTARMLEEEGRMREALSHYLAFLRVNPGNAELVTHIAELALDYQGLDAAVNLLEEGIKANGDRPEPYVNFTQFALTHGNEENGLLQRAETAAADAVTRFPKRTEAYENAVRLQLAQGKKDVAATTLDKAVKQDSAEASFWLGLGRVAQEVWPLADGENREAHVAKVNPFFEKAALRAQAAQDEDAELRVADYYLFSNQIEKAATICERLVKRTGSLASHKRLVRLYDALERPAESFQALEALVKAYPQDVEHRKLLAGHYVQRAQNAARALDNEGTTTASRQAVEQLEAALQAGGGDLGDYLQISGLLRVTQEPERFERFTARAQQLFPGEPRMGWFRAVALGQLKKYADAAKIYEESAKLAETRAPEILDDQYHFAWGVALERSGQFDAAARQFQKSIDLTPAEAPPRAAGTMNYLGYMWLEQNRHLDAAETLIRKANEMEPDNAAFVDSLGWLFFKQGKFSDALTELLRSEKLLRAEQPKPEPGDAEIYDHIAQTYDKLGQRDKALEYWQHALDVHPEVPAIRERAKRELGIAKPTPPKPETPEGAAPANPPRSF